MYLISQRQAFALENCVLFSARQTIDCDMGEIWGDEFDRLVVEAAIGNCRVVKVDSSCDEVWIGDQFWVGEGLATGGWDFLLLDILVVSMQLCV